MPETMKSFNSTKILLGKTKNGKNVLRLEVVEVVLASSFQSNLLDNWYQQKSKDMDFYRKHRKQLLDAGPDAPRTASRKVLHKAAEATGELLGNKIADKIAKPLMKIHEMMKK